MESPNFIIDGHLRLPGLVRMPPPFGPALDSAQPSPATQVSPSSDPVAHTCGDAGTARHGQWRQRMTALSVGMACTLAAALLGWQTGQHRQPAAEWDQATVAAIAPQTVPPLSLEHSAATPAASADPNEATESAGAPTAVAAADVVQTPDVVFDETEVATPVIAAAAPAVTQLPARPRRPRPVAQAAVPASTPPKLQRLPVLHDEAPATIEVEWETAATAPITSAYAAPGTPVRIELQRHTRFTD
ncbi:ribonuclease E [Ralstonia sp. UNC404CL21Col]|uniref:ribonuclease E n=1 Tax=Ralstonia sp. UNC404CL21Col TaxID=1380362 RepID=UPI001E5B5DAD|nr:ribonuclease E [Ralstonia sp. UNC404CL21Col]